MEHENTEDITFKLLTNPTKLKKKTIIDEYDEDDDFLKLKRISGYVVF